MPATSILPAKPVRFVPLLFDNTPPGGLPPARRAPSTRPPRKKYFAAGAKQDAGHAAAVVRGILVNAADRSYCDGELGRVLFRDSDDAELRNYGMKVFQELMLALFPEEFAGPGHEPGLVPAFGPKRAGADRLLLFVEVVSGQRAFR